MRPAICWFRRDLRLSDNPALSAAAHQGRPVIAVYIHSPEEAGPWAEGAASRWWLHHSLQALGAALQAQGISLQIHRGPALNALQTLIRETDAEAVHWNRLYDPAIIERDRAIKAQLQADGIEVNSHNAALLREPWTVKTGTGGPYRAFTPFWRAAQRESTPPQPLPIPPLTGPALSSPLRVDDLALLPTIRWDTDFPAYWQPGEVGAQARLQQFVEQPIHRYDTDRDFPAINGTSGLSAHLHFGEISPRQIWHAAPARESDDVKTFLAEIGWREFAHHVLFHHPSFPDEPLNPRFADFPWADDPDHQLLKAWQRGNTGIPLVDAGMRELWHTGWMHNRVRMVVGSFLVKNLRLPWQQGEAWFWDTLVDADLASNSLGWQWVAGSGADAAPYFRIFNPIRQSERFDAEGAYIARWIPELSRLPAKHRHAPFEAPADVLAEAGVTLGVHYPWPIVDLKASRQAALAAFAKIKKSPA